MIAKALPCPCGGADYATCCGRYHNGEPAPDALALMRSRYTAYVLKLEPYLLATWHRSTRPISLDLATENGKWLGLEVKKHKPESTQRASVEFVARYKIGGRATRMHEKSRFVCEGGQWFYLDGEFVNAM